MLSETDRNREMCNQIVRQVFPDPNQADHCPVGRSVSYHFVIVISEQPDSTGYDGPTIAQNEALFRLMISTGMEESRNSYRRLHVNLRRPRTL